jgi:hypothetical protein
MDTSPTVTLWRPTGPDELALVRASGWRAWPPRLPDQPIFYPVLNEEYATMIARDWNVPASGAGYVTRFEARADFLARYEVHQVGGRTISSTGSRPKILTNSTPTSWARSRSSPPTPERSR